MSNIIPPLLCNTPPPPPSPDEEDEDEFGDFSGANDYSYGCDNLSLPSTPEDSPKKVIGVEEVDINCNAENKNGDQATADHVQKDYLDRRKSNDSFDSDKLKYFNYEVDKIDTCNDINRDLFVDVSESAISDNINHNSPIENNENIVNIGKFDKSHCKPERIEDLPLDELSFGNCEQDSEFMKEISDFSDVYRAIEQTGYSNNEFGDFVVNTKIEDNNKIELNNGDVDIEYVTSSFIENMKESGMDVNEEKITSAIDEVEDVYVHHNHLFEGESHFKDDELTFDPNSESNSLKESNREVKFDYDLKQNALNTSVTSELKFEERLDNQEVHEEAEVDNEFGDFEAANPNIGDAIDEEFGNFASHEETVGKSQIITSTSNQADDEFGDFGAFASFPEEPCIKYVQLNEKEAYQKAKEILKEMVPDYEAAGEEVDVKELGTEDYVFNQLKDVTDTPALNYQWSKSSSQKMLLKALNIDARNILYGPSWNPTMPRFAANLTMEPLEPIKTECVSPSLYKSSPSYTQQPPAAEVPSAQFDWSGSGLTNPLDHLEQLVASLDISICNPAAKSQNSPSSPNNDLEDWDLWLKSISAKTEDLMIETIRDPHIASRTQDETSRDTQPESFDEFTSYQSTPMPQVSNSWSKQVPLRETYISSSDNQEVVPEVPLNVEAWLQPTIVTPELPRKQIDAEEDIIAEKREPGTGYVDLEGSEIKNEVGEDVEVATSSSVLSKAELSIFDSLSKSEDIVTSSSESSPERAPSKISERIQEPVESFSNEEDEFTDFQFSIPVAEPPRPSKPLTPILEPLKPVPAPSNTVLNAVPAQINWPDPGITEEELKKFDEVFSQPVRQKQSEPTKSIQPAVVGSVQPQPKVTRPIQTEASKPAQLDLKLHKQSNSFGDDEWTDFMSVQKSSPVHKLKTSSAGGREQTSSPDLTLSVFNLGNIQPARPPVPVITPKGLVQTKLSTNLNQQVPMSPKATPKNNVLIPQSAYFAPQPSIISRQFASQAYSFGNNLRPTRQSGAEDEEWGDFVSAQTVANGWPSADANHHAQQNQFKMASTSTKSSLSNSVALPELEFVAPKGRTHNTRNK